jgi:predicted TIM-barrel fold metal-dependent hydrolase
MIVDAHTHIWPRWPYDPPVPDAESRGSYENLVFQLDQNGVDQALVVNARIDRAEDNNEYGAEAVAAYPGRLHHVIDIDSRWGPDYHRPGAADRLRALVDRFDPSGISHYLAPEVDDWFGSADAGAFFDLVAERRMLVTFAAPSVWLDQVRVLAKRYPDIPFLVNHLAVVMLHPGGVDEGLRLVLDDEDIPNLLVKVSGYYYGHDRPWDYPYLDRLPIVRAFHQSWGAGRMVWASDWPSLLPHHSYRQALQVLREHADFLSPAELDAIQGGNLAGILADRARVGR